MNRLITFLSTLAIAVTIASLFLWIGTGRHFYTKYQVVETREVPVDSRDPLADAGFYDSETRVETVQKEEFHFGLLPTPQGMFDKHILSVLSLVTPAWLAYSLLLLGRRRFSGH